MIVKDKMKDQKEMGNVYSAVRSVFPLEAGKEGKIEDLQSSEMAMVDCQETLMDMMKILGTYSGNY